jgi:hypothetical protein
MMQLAEDWLDQDEYERRHFEPGRVVVRIPVTADNVSSSDLSKVPLPVAPAASRPGWERDTVQSLNEQAREHTV